MRSLARTLLPLLVAVLGAGCGIWRPTPVPLRTIALPAACATRPDTLIVFLPGSYELPEAYLERGFVARLRERHVAADVLLVDAHLGYYGERSILERLQHDVVEPARAAGYRKLWWVGISVGAYGALVRAASTQQPAAELDGIVALAPYLGDRRYAQAVRDSGGLGRWPTAAQPVTGDADELLWRWLQATLRERPDAPLYLAYGDDDRFAFSDGTLAAALPPGHVFTGPGGHDWPIWVQTWARLVPILPLPVDASCRDNAAS